MRAKIAPVMKPVTNHHRHASRHPLSVSITLFLVMAEKAKPHSRLRARACTDSGYLAVGFASRTTNLGCVSRILAVRDKSVRARFAQQWRRRESNPRVADRCPRVFVHPAYPCLSVTGSAHGKAVPCSTKAFVQ